MSVPSRILLSIADPPAGAVAAGSSLASLRASEGLLREAGWRLRVHSYAEALAGIPDPPDEAVCLLHFPYRYWDEEVEGKIPDTYGTGQYGAILREHLLATGLAIRGSVPHGLAYINDPSAVALTRDKIALKQRLTAAGVPTPKAFAVSSAEDIRHLLADGRRLYVKAAHASMNKGIAVLSARHWRTNYGFDGRRLGPGTPEGNGWRFHDVPTGNPDFLSALCGTQGFLYEEAADGTEVSQGERRELRVTVAGGRVLAAEMWRAPGTAVTVSPAEGGQRLSPASDFDPETLPPGTAAAALSATEAAGLQYAVHDIVLDHAWQPFVVDVQAFPALGTPPWMFGELLAICAAPKSLSDSRG